MNEPETPTRQHYLRYSSEELKKKLVVYNKALSALTPESRETVHGYINDMIDILKERDEL